MKTFTQFFIAICFTAFTAFFPTVVTAQFSALTNEARVNTTTSGQQSAYWWSLRTVAVQPGGGYIIVWIDYAGNDGQGQGIYGQMFNASGVKVGSQFLVNTTTAGDQFSPSIAVAHDGSFLVAWEGPGSSIDVFAQKFTSNGTKDGAEFLLNTTVSGNQRYPEIQYYPDGTFIAAYVDASSSQTVIQRFDKDNRTIGQETRIGSGSGSVVLDGLCVRPDNSVLLFWTTSGDVYGQIFDYNLNGVGSAKMLNTYTAGTQQYCLGRVDGDGNMVFVWESAGQDGSGNGVYCRRFDKNFNALGNEFAITGNTTGDQFGPSVGVEPGGRFVIAWDDNNNRDGGGASADLAGPGSSIWMREFDKNGNAVGVETRVNQSITGYQGYPLIDMNASGRFVIDWEGNGTQAGNIDNFGVFCRSYQLSQTGISLISVSPTTATASDLVTVTMTLASLSSITNVTPNPLSLSGTNGVYATLVSGPSPASATVGVAPVSFTWTYRVTAAYSPGALTFMGNAHGNGGAIFPFATSNSISIKPAIFISDITATNLVGDANAPSTGPQVFTIGAKITNASLNTLTNVVINLGDGVTAGTFPVTTMTLAQTNNTYQGSFALQLMAGSGDGTRPQTDLGPAKAVIAGGIDFDGNGVVNTLDDGILSNGKKVVDGKIDVNTDGIVNTSDDLPRPPGAFYGYRDPAIIDGYVDSNNDGVINALDNATYGGTTLNVYWQAIYKVTDAFGKGTFGDCNDFNDDLRYNWFIWATGQDAGITRTDVIHDYAKVRCELSASSNKITPTGNPTGYISGGPPHVLAGLVDINSDGQITNADDGTYKGKTVIDGKVDMNSSGTITTADDGLLDYFNVIDGLIDVNNDGIISNADDGILVTVGQTFTVTVHNATFGTIGNGFDENRDNLWDLDFWYQPVGKTNWPATSFRLVDIQSDVTGTGGNNPLNGITTHYDNEPYLSRLFDDRLGQTGGFYATYTYTFLAVAPGNGYITPYQEAASGTNNEKYNGDYGSGVSIWTSPLLVALPVKLLTFNANLDQSQAKVNLTWTTAHEFNASHFVVERSTDGTNFSEVGIVFAFGNTAEQKSYKFPDNIASLNATVFYYRLRQVDVDGKAEYSATRIVRITKQLDNNITVYAFPNPTVNELYISVPNQWQGKKVTYEVFNAYGQVSTKTESAASSQTETVNMSRFARGLYIVRVSCNGQTAEQKIIKN